MKKADAYGSGEWLRAGSDGTLALPGSPQTLVATISRVESHEFDDGKSQRVLVFTDEKLPKLGLNVTNWDSISKITGKDDDDHWPGASIELFAVPEPKSRSGWAVRVRKAPVNPAAVAANPDAPLGAGSEKNLMDKITKMRETSEAVSMDALRSALAVKHPTLESVIAGTPSTWPRKFLPDISAWIAENETIPF